MVVFMLVVQQFISDRRFVPMFIFFPIDSTLLLLLLIPPTASLKLLLY